MKIEFYIRNSKTKKPYLKNLPDFHTAIDFAELIGNKPLEIVRTTEEVIKKYGE